MRYGRIHRHMLSMLLLVFSVAIADAGTPKTVELNSKVSEISSLQHILEEKIDIAAATRDQLQEQVNELAAEIHQLCNDDTNMSYQAAIKSPRINYNLKLIGQLSGYIERLNKRISYFQIGNEMLAFLLQQIRDDLRLIRTLNDMQVDKLIYRVNDVLDDYLPETKKHLISLEGLQWQSSEMIWNEIIKKKP